MKKLFYEYRSRVLAITILIVLYALAAPEKVDKFEKAMFEKEFSFSSSTLFQPEDLQSNSVRSVHPQYEHISAWISSVGAAVSFADLDNDRLYDDIIHVDPRFDKAYISNLKDPAKYTPFSLEATPLPYDENTMSPMGSLTNDFNGDGKNDILLYYWGRTPILFLASEYGFSPVELSPKKERWFTNAATTADFDGDGHLDILIGNYFPDGAKVLDENADDKDQVMQHSMTRADNGARNHMFLYNKKTGFYTEVEDWYDDFERPLDWTLALAAADLNGDMKCDIYVSNDFGPDKLLYNNSSPGKLKFTMLKGKKKLNTISSSVLGKDSFKGMGADVSDIDGDGLLDIYVSNIADEYALEESHFAFISTGQFDLMESGIAPFVNRSEELGLSRSSWGWDSKLADLNNDGLAEALQATGFVKGKIDRWPELQELAMGNDELLAIPGVWPNFQPGADLSGYEANPLFARNDQGYFFDISELAGVAHEQVTRGIATCDFDADGDLDFVVANQWEDSRLYKNNYNGSNSYLAIVPVQVYHNLPKVTIENNENYKGRIATGAMVSFNINGKQYIDYSDGGNGHSGADGQEIFFGLGSYDANEIEVLITWRDLNGNEKKENIKLPLGRSVVYLP
ncbi:MAG: VCBS repeat-containing protein [Chitinophagales bacterium]|nr:VCBS repeat-containing protein [Chitinophagales bacterium]